jgi:hypothetical protein
MSLLPVVAVIEGSVDRQDVDASAFAPRSVRYAPRWGAKVVPFEPFTEAARALRTQASAYLAEVSGSDAPAWLGSAESPPVALVVNDELEAHILARLILSLMSAGLEDIRLRRIVEGGSAPPSPRDPARRDPARRDPARRDPARGEAAFASRETSWEVRLHPVAAQHVQEEQVRGRAKVEIFGPFDYDGAERTLQRHARAGRPASAQLVLFALIASRALYRALDAVRATWPDADPDILLVLPQQVP